MNYPAIKLCPHKQNPTTCLTCFRLPKPSTTQVQRNNDPDVPQNALGAPFGTLPGRQVVPYVDPKGADVGTAGSGAQQFTEAEKEKYRYPKGRPVADPNGPRAQPQAHTTVSAGGVDDDGLWQPAAREEVISQLPTHPKGVAPR